MATTNPKNSTNVTGIAPDNTVTADTPNAVQKIITAKWMRKIRENITEVETAKIKGKVTVSIETENIADDTEIVISILDAKDNSELTTKTVKIRNNKIFNSDNTDNTTEVSIEDSWSNKALLISVTKDKNSILDETYTGTKKLHIGCCEHTIMIEDTGDFIEELHIRLCGFGGLQPYRKVSDKTIVSVKQFQKDYMKVEETGYICKHVLEKLDEFKDKYSISFNQLKCTCGSNDVDKLNRITGIDEKGSCSGFGNVDDRKKDVVLTRIESAPTIEKVTKDGKTTEVVKETTHTIENEYSNYVLAYNYKDNNPKKSKLNKEWIKADENRQVKTTKYITKLKYTTLVGSNSCYEYPGMHRSLMWAYKAIAFYLEKEYGETDTKYTINKISSGYRCRYQNTFQNASSGLTFNHMGTALDIHFNKNGARTTEHPKEMDKLRDEICVKYIGAHKGWTRDKLGLELAAHGATSWIHIDVREFSNYKADKFFKTTEDDINGGKLSDIIKTMDEGKYKSIIE